MEPRLFLILPWLLIACATPERGSAEAPDSLAWAAQREAMVRDQIAARGINDPRVLAALRRVPRHELVPEPYRSGAYSDGPLPIGEDQTISQPFVVAYMTDRLDLKEEDRVLEIGTGSGYQAAVLAELVAEVYTIEIVPSLAARAARDLKRLGYRSVHVQEGDGYLGWPEEAPFDAIMVTAAPDHVPPTLVEQLARGGRMILPLGDVYQRLVIITKGTEGDVKQTELLPVRFVPMTGEAEAPR